MRNLFGIRRHLLLTLFLILGMASGFAEKNPDEDHAFVELRDGSMIEGYVTTSLINYFKPNVTKFGLSDELGGKDRKYTSEEVKSIIFPLNEKDSTAVIYHSLKATKQLPNLLNKKPKPSKEPIFLRLVFEGKHVKGYARPLFDSTHGGTMSTFNYTWRYYYKTDDNEIAVAYWDDIRGIFPALKKFMKLIFHEFPELQQMIDEGTVSPHDFRENCLTILPIIDEILDKRSLAKSCNP